MDNVEVPLKADDSLGDVLRKLRISGLLDKYEFFIEHNTLVCRCPEEVAVQVTAALNDAMNNTKEEGI